METLQKVSHVGCDLHKKFTIATARDAQNRLLWRQRLEHADRPRLRAQLGTWPKGTPVIFEASFGWGWFADVVQAAQLEPHLASSRKVAAWREARGLPKSNRVDADLLSELWGQQPRWWEVWLAPPAVRDQREWLRYRMALVRIQTGLKNRVHAVLHRHGLVHEFADLFGRDGRRFLSLLAGPRDVTLPDSARATLKGQLQLLDQVRRQIAQATRVFRRTVERDPVAERLRRLPGIGYVLAYLLVAEIGRIERFANYKHLASYSLLAPRAYDSGEPEDGPPQGRHVGYIGRRMLKWAFIEAARGAVRHGGRWRQMYDRRTDGGQRNRNRGYIAVGRELAHVVDLVWRKGVEYSEEPPPRPGSRRRTKRSRPGTGQPVDAMVGVAG
jgi:transposase